MVKNIRVLQFIEAVKLDCGVELSPDEASKILNGIVGYLSILEKIYLRMKNKNNNMNKN